MQKFLKFFSLQILRAKICDKFTEVPLDKTKCCEFFHIFPTIVEVKNVKNEICIINDDSSSMEAIGLKICTKQS